jgi:hypothetical protein
MPASPGPAASMEPAEILKLALQVSIMRMLLISLVSMFIVMPFIALALVLVCDPPQLARVALVALALSPVPPILLTRQRKAGGRDSYSLGLTAAVSILSIVLVPALVAFLGRLMDRPFQMGPAAIAGQVVVVAVVLPLVAGMLLRAFLPRVAERLEKPAALVANVELLGAAVVVLVAAFPRLAQSSLSAPSRQLSSLRRWGWPSATFWPDRTLGILRCWLSPAPSGPRAAPWRSRARTSRRWTSGGDHPVSAHRRRRVHSLHETDASARRSHAGSGPGPKGVKEPPRYFPGGRGLASSPGLPRKSHSQGRPGATSRTGRMC